MAQRILLAPVESPKQKLRWAFLQVLSRKPAEAEQQVLLEVYDDQLRQYADQSTRARQLVQVGQAPLADDVDVVPLAAWTAVARVLLNLHETITRY